jgi:Fe-S-cluster-containing hydrogenase component 2/CRP-like cAMP-binding protein
VSRYERELARRVEAQALACIGCNDCLLACPVPESRSVTIGELNASIHLPLITQKNVVDFLGACTQCKQCVPACPADLSRAEMVLFNKLKVENSIPNHELLLQTKTGTRRSGWMLDALAQNLATLELFKNATVLSLRRLLQKSTLRLLSAGEELCREGEFYERLAVVLSGSLVQTSTGPKGERLQLVVLAPGAFLGEMGVLGDCAEAYGALARELSVVLEAPKLAVSKLMEEAPAFGETLDLLYARHALYSHARSPGALGSLPEAATLELFAEAKLELVPAGHALFAQTDRPRDFFIVRSGFLRAVQLDANGERVLTYFREGDLFGLSALLAGEAVAGYGVTAVGRAEVVRIPGVSLGQVFARYPGAHHALAQGAFEAERLARARDVGVGPMHLQQYPSHSVPPRGSIPSPSSPPNYEKSGERSLSGERARLEAGVLVEAGIAKGREVLVVDQNLCTGCNNCIDACERRHGMSRLQLRGLQVEHYMFPTACRHCADPTCLLCSVNGIVRLPSGEIQIVEDNCIGCGACAERCPYGNISMHAVNREKRGFLPSLFDFLRGSPTRERALEELDPKVQRVAVKCDLCAGHSDYACVTACPVSANFRVDPARLVAAQRRETR